MHFKVTARTILQLGAELISSDAIAFYELIKNAFDAGSKKVDVRVIIRIDQIKTFEILELLETMSNKISSKEYSEIVSILIESVDYNLQNSKELVEELKTAKSVQNLTSILKRANYIVFKDTGQGMSLTDLEDIYLTIGTRNRRKERQNAKSDTLNRPILGEKGLGRLSVMRLGNLLHVETTQKNTANFNLLEINWSDFSNDSDALLESVEIEPTIGEIKANKDYQGTTITISDLKSRWSNEIILNIVREELSRFIDPFETKNREFISLWFNNQPIRLVGIDKSFFDNAQAVAKGKFMINDNNKPIFQGEIEYKTYNRKKVFSIEGTHIVSLSEVAPSVLNSLGPFNVEFYWYNRQRISKKYGIFDTNALKNFVRIWAGGLMLYRDGFRVNPYGGQNDDWLKLDLQALASSGYKLNRRQIIGKVEITSNRNPNLIDQTNREGIRDNEEKKALTNLLKYLIQKEVKNFLDAVLKEEEEKVAAINLDDIEKQMNISEIKINDAIKKLITLFPAAEVETNIVSSVKEFVNEGRKVLNSAKASSNSLEKRLATTIQLAGQGLMVDIVAHELNRTTHQAIRTINGLSSNDLSKNGSTSMNLLKGQLQTLQTRLKVLDPLGPSGRQRKEKVDIHKLICDTLEYHHAQFSRHFIKSMINDNGSGKWEIQAVPGMIVQIIENLISNSVYWLKQEQKMGRLKNAEICININRSQESIVISDNGPGIPSAKREEIFQAFVSTKPPGLGKGLGLYISREIAYYHGADLYLYNNGESTLRDFVLELSKSN